MRPDHLASTQPPPSLDRRLNYNVWTAAPPGLTQDLHPEHANHSHFLQYYFVYKQSVTVTTVLCHCKNRQLYLILTIRVAEADLALQGAASFWRG
jgi:hypothetical protein